MKFRTAAFTLALLLANGVTWAEDRFRCPRTERLVEIGDTPAEVEAKCGPPARREIIPRRGRGSRSEERWLYDFGATYMVRILTFVFGRLERVEVGDYGK